MVETTQDGLGRSSSQPTFLRRLLRKIIHRLSYHFILKRERTTVVHAAGFRLTVRPTVFHPAYFLTSEFFAGFIGRQDWTGKRVADVGTGSGILALAAARAGAANVVAIDINPNAACAARENAGANGLGDRVSAVCSNLLAALAPRPHFDVILSSPPSFPGEPLDLADRAWHAGPDYRDIAFPVRPGAQAARARRPLLRSAFVGFRHRVSWHAGPERRVPLAHRGGAIDRDRVIHHLRVARAIDRLDQLGVAVRKSLVRSRRRSRDRGPSDQRHGAATQRADAVCPVHDRQLITLRQST